MKTNSPNHYFIPSIFYLIVSLVFCEDLRIISVANTTFQVSQEISPIMNTAIWVLECNYNVSHWCLEWGNLTSANT
jgi:hypothetical protein